MPQVQVDASLPEGWARLTSHPDSPLATGDGLLHFESGQLLRVEGINPRSGAVYFRELGTVEGVPSP